MMRLHVSEHSTAGHKSVNQDALLYHIPDAHSHSRGAVFILCDGISSSEVSQYASQFAAQEFVKQYYDASPLWSPLEAAQRAAQYCNFALFCKTQNSEFKDNPDRGYVCTFVALIVLPEQYYVFHVGDSRCYRLTQQLSLLTSDHNDKHQDGQHYLSGALGHKSTVNIAYHSGLTEQGQHFLLTTDGVHDSLNTQQLTVALRHSVDDIAANLTQQALKAGSKDNLSAISIYIGSVATDRVSQSLYPLPFLSSLEIGDRIDDYIVTNVLHRNHRSHVYAVKQPCSQQTFVLKTPSIEFEHDEQYIDAFKNEEWITQRIDSPFVVKTVTSDKPRSALYSLYQYIDGQSLTAWLNDQGPLSLTQIRRVADQLANAVQALHRQETLHRDIRPENILMDQNGQLHLIDLGCASVENHIATLGLNHMEIPGTAIYTAPEYFLGEPGSQAADIYSMAVLIYFLLSGEFPYGTNVAKATNYAAQLKLKYTSLLLPTRSIPVWVDETIRKATHIDPNKRYQEVSEFIHDLHHPNPRFLKQYQRPLLERKPVQFWQTVSAGLFIIICILIATR